VAHFFGIEPWFHRACDRLSGGQQQILNLASSLCLQPRLLLLDEPTAQLDPVAASQFAHALFRINRELGITVVVATHDALALRPYATHEFHMQDGGLHQGALAASEADAVCRPVDDMVDSGSSPLISCKRTYFRYEHDAPWVLRGLDLSIAAGKVHALVGGNGSGKTTALLCMAGVLCPSRGSLSNASHAQALLPQDPKALMVCDSVEDELREWQGRCGFDDAAVDDAVARFGLEEVLTRHPFDTSGGQQQCIALAKLLLTRPDLLLLDEPTKGLDIPTRRMLADQVRALRAAGTTVVLASHDLAFVAAVADQVTMLFDGQAASTEPCERFLRNNVFFRPSAEACAQLGLALPPQEGMRFAVDATETGLR
jgi:energy-coupling factor transport system ATP-binding protein